MNQIRIFVEIGVNQVVPSHRNSAQITHEHEHATRMILHQVYGPVCDEIYLAIEELREEAWLHGPGIDRLHALVEYLRTGNAQTIRATMPNVELSTDPSV
jgi:hypothetical protein